MKKLLVVDLFSGAGGFSRGFEDSGFFVTIIAVDCDRAAARSFKANFPHAQVLCEDIKNVSGDDLKHLAGSSPDIVIGSPPCEPFTGANPRREPDPLDRLYKDPLGRLTLEFIRIVGELQPKVFVMENVPAIMDGPLREALIKEFASVGYSRVFFNVLRAEDYGTPSHRKRVFVSNVFVKPKPTKKRITVDIALRDLPPPGTTSMPNHDPVPMSDRKLRRISVIRRGKALYYYEGAGKRLPNYIRLNPRALAPTVLGCSRFIHPFENRLLTVREQARLMGFPDDHVFLGGRDEQFNQVGEAVPPPLAKAIALYLAENYLR